MKRVMLIAFTLAISMACSCSRPCSRFNETDLIQDVDKWFESERGFGSPEKFQIAHQGRNYLVIINCPFSGRDATLSYILEEREQGHVLLQKLHHPEGSIAHTVELWEGALMFKGANDRPVLVYWLPEGAHDKPDAGDGK